MTTILFPSLPFQPDEIDADFEVEQAAAVATGFVTALVDHTRVTRGDTVDAVSWVPRDSGPCIYRGWMLKAAEYADMYAALADRGALLRTTAAAYRTCHHLPDNYPFIEGHTPRSTWAPLDGDPTRVWIADLVASFGDGPLVVKDYVKSQKHYWAEACFIPCASDLTTVERVTRRFIELQGEDLNIGLVYRAFVPLKIAGMHPRSGMPLAEEFRIFWAGGEPLLVHRYWGDLVELDVSLPVEELAPLAATIPSEFFTMDVAMRKDGQWTIVELGDGQVAGLPAAELAPTFYAELKRIMDSNVA